MSAGRTRIASGVDGVGVNVGVGTGEFVGMAVGADAVVDLPQALNSNMIMSRNKANFGRTDLSPQLECGNYKAYRDGVGSIPVWYATGGYFTAILIFLGLADSALGRRKSRMPLVMCASTLSASIGAGRRRVRVKEPLGSSFTRY